MQNAGWIVFKSLLSKHQRKKTNLLNFLTRKAKESFNALPSDLFKDPLQGISPAGKLIENIHPTWITPVLRTLAENDIRLFLASLGETKRNEIKQNLLLSNHFPHLNERSRDFIQEQLFLKVKDGQSLLPIECLPQHPLNELLNLDTSQLMRLIELLGLHDVAFDLRHIIETAKIKQIYSALEQNEQAYLQSVAQEKESFAFKRIGLDKWDGNTSYLKTIIRQRGINRLAKALYGQNASLIWYVAHKMETSQAAELYKLCTDLKHPQGLTYLIKQISDLITLIKGKKI